MLTIIFKDGTLRRLHPTADFFSAGKVSERLSKDQLINKTTDIVSDFGPYKQMYSVSLYQGQTKLLELGPHNHNKPFSAEPEEKIDYSQQLKDLKSEVENKKFTTRILRNADGVFVFPIK